MRRTLTSRYDVAEHLRTPEEMAAYLEACRAEADDDAAFIAEALGDIARARGMSQVARDGGLSRESLYEALSGERTPGFDTILKVMAALDLELHAEAVHISDNAEHPPSNERAYLAELSSLRNCGTTVIRDQLVATLERFSGVKLAIL